MVQVIRLFSYSVLMVALVVATSCKEETAATGSSSSASTPEVSADDLATDLETTTGEGFDTFNTVTTGTGTTTTDLTTTTTSATTVPTSSDIPSLFRARYASSPDATFYQDFVLTGSIGEHLEQGQPCPSGYVLHRTIRDCKETANVATGTDQCKGLRNLCRLTQPIQNAYAVDTPVVYDFILSPLDYLYYNSCPATHPYQVGEIARCDADSEFCQGRRLMCVAKKALGSFAPNENFLQELWMTPWAETEALATCPAGYQWSSYPGEKHWFTDNDVLHNNGYPGQGVITECQRMQPVYSL